MIGSKGAIGVPEGAGAAELPPGSGISTGFEGCFETAPEAEDARCICINFDPPLYFSEACFVKEFIPAGFKTPTSGFLTDRQVFMEAILTCGRKDAERENDVPFTLTPFPGLSIDSVILPRFRSISPNNSLI